MATASYIILVSGFTQHRGHFHGILKLREDLLAAQKQNGENHRVWYYTWNEDMRRVASELNSVATYHGHKPRVMLVGYSYGGWGSLRLAKALDRRGIPVEHHVLSDPVGRPIYWPTPLPAPSSLLGRRFAWPLMVPGNVRDCWHYHQIENRPQGHRLKAVDPTRTTIHRSKRLHISHNQMDDSKVFHKKVLSLAPELTR